MAAAAHAQLVTMIDAAVDDYRAFLPRHRRDRIRQVCIEAVEFGRDAPAGEVGMRTQTSAQLLLELLCPQVNQAIRDALAFICADIAVAHG